jgi:hypothetical protein
MVSFRYAGLFWGVLAVAVIGNSDLAIAQQTFPQSTTVENDIDRLRPGMSCQVRLKTPVDHFKPGDPAKIKEIAKDEIIVSQIVEGRKETKMPILGDLPFFGKFFTKRYSGRNVVTSRIPIKQIAQIQPLDSAAAR